jgi:ubiquinone/menaquinone biosynthesis C-methylase UbiE
VFKTDTGAAMRRDWDERARKDAFHYVATWRRDWTVDDFLESGEQEYLKLVQPVLNRFQFAAQGASMLEVGCGAGRMTGSFARRFRTVHALDISAEMQNLAKQGLTGFENIRWVLGDGTDLSLIPTNSVDFVFSYLVLQHLPTEELALTYVREMLRVLNERGVFLFQFNGQKLPTMNWKGRLAWGAVDVLWSLNLKELSQTTARWMGFDPAAAGKSWRGASLPADRVAQTIQASGASALQIAGGDTPMAWCWGRKQAQTG